jgi:hypothetical protein
MFYVTVILIDVLLLNINFTFSFWLCVQLNPKMQSYIKSEKKCFLVGTWLYGKK